MTAEDDDNPKVKRVKHGHTVDVFVCGVDCKDQQPHRWDGPTVEFDGGASVTCSICGLDAMSYDLMRLP
jgi:hypothetical protein